MIVSPPILRRYASTSLIHPPNHLIRFGQVEGVVVPARMPKSVSKRGVRGEGGVIVAFPLQRLHDGLSR
jgi:hypothetical protein